MACRIDANYLKLVQSTAEHTLQVFQATDGSWLHLQL